MRWRIAGLAGLILAGCDRADPASTAQRPAAQHIVDPATGETRMIIPRPDGAATLRSGPDVPLALPKGFSLPDGTRVLTNSLFSRPDGDGTLVTFEAEPSAQAVIGHYRDQARAAGFAITVEVETAGTFLMVGERKKDGARLAVTATEGVPTQGQLIVSANAPG
jgi:hypothetical protein